MASTNEWEFAGEVLSWVNAFISDHTLPFAGATQEFPNSEGKRSDLVIWIDRTAEEAILEAEFKKPTADFGDFSKDAVRKAQKIGAPYLVLWNMRRLSIYRTPTKPRKDLLPDDLIAPLGEISELLQVDDWQKSTVRPQLKRLAEDLVRAVHDLHVEGAIAGRIIEPTVFVDWLSERIGILRRQITGDFQTGLGKSRKLRQSVYEWAEKQGLRDFVDDLNESLAAQRAYRLAGQILFYYAFRRKETSLPKLELDKEKPVSAQLRTYWDAVRAFDYEALYDDSPLEEVALGDSTERTVADLIEQLARFKWDEIELDVLGSIFENMIPPHERRVLGQYYTPPQLADLIIALTVDTPDDVLLDPGVGTGTFLYRAYDRFRAVTKADHADLLDQLWGVDISAFPAELAVINLYRLNLEATSSFPRIAVRDFFQLRPGEKLSFPPAKRNQGSTVKVDLELPLADALVGNPPYVRSQQLDDLEKSYKDQLNQLAAQAGVTRTAKFDAFAYYLVHAAEFVKDGARLGFVIPGAWLNAEYGAALQQFLLESFQPVLILMSEAEVYFPSQDVNTVVLIAERTVKSGLQQARGPIRFVTLTSRIDQLVPGHSSADYWTRMDRLAAQLETLAAGEYADYRIDIINGEVERKALVANPTEPRDWTRRLRATTIYRDIFEA